MSPQLGAVSTPVATNLRFASIVDGVLNLILAVALVAELVVVVCNVIGRAFLAQPILWSNEAAELALSTMAFVGGTAAYRHGGHPAIDIVGHALSAGGRRAVAVLLDFVVLGIAVLVGSYSWPLILSRWDETLPVLQVPSSLVVMPLSFGMAVLALSAVERLLAKPFAVVVSIALAIFAFGLLVALTQQWWLDWASGDSTSLGLSLALFFAAVVIGLPVSFALLIGAGSYLYVSDTVPMIALPQNMVDGTGAFVLLALPFFVLAGIIMEQGGIGVRLVRFVHALVGHIRGGLLQVIVVSMYLVSGISGSKAADVAAVGSVVRDTLRDEGYSLEQGAAVLAASAAMGETIPPSIAMLVLGSITSLSMAALFIAGLIPAAVVALCLMALIYGQARLSRAPARPRVGLRVLGRVALGAVLPMLMPVFLFVGIIFGIATPTEVSAFAVLYGLLLSVLIYRELSGQAFIGALIICARMSGVILFIVAAASSFSWVLTSAGLPQYIVDLLNSAGDSQAIFLLGSCLLLIIVGSVLEGLPALLILAPLMLPVAQQMGISPLHYGIVLVMAIGIGAFVPPIGIGFYIACTVTQSSIERTARTMIPFVAVLFIGLLIVAFVPWFTLSLPRYFGFSS